MTIDVFLCHNSKDKPFVIKIAKALSQRGLNPWIDKNNIDPGAEFQRAIEEAIPQTKSAAIFFGLDGVGKWQHEEINALYREKVNRQIRLIPVLLPGVSKIPAEYVFLQGHNWLQLVSQEIDEQFLDDFVGGIEGQKPKSQQTNEESLPRQNSTSCVDRLGQLTKAELRRLIVRRLNLSEVRTVWFDTLSNQMDNFMSGRSLEDCVIDLLQRAEQRGLTRKLIENLCAERPDIVNP